MYCLPPSLYCCIGKGPTLMWPSAKTGPDRMARPRPRGNMIESVAPWRFITVFADLFGFDLGAKRPPHITLSVRLLPGRQSPLEIRILRDHQPCTIGFHYSPPTDNCPCHVKWIFTCWKDTKMCSITTKWGSPRASVCEEKKRQLRLVYDHKSPYFLHDFIYPMNSGWLAGRPATSSTTSVPCSLTSQTNWTPCCSLRGRTYALEFFKQTRVKRKCQWIHTSLLALTILLLKM